MNEGQGRYAMKILGRNFVWPFLIKMGNAERIVEWNYGLYVDVSRMGGTMTTVTYSLVYHSSWKFWCASFCWRPSVTAYWWKKSAN